jgi:RNA polymerase sigma factor (sigma-70 family)
MPSEATGSVTHFFGRLRAGQREAADELWQRYCPRLLALARKTLSGRLPRGADPEDAVQSAFVSFLQRAEQGKFVGDIDRNRLWNLLGLITVRKALKQLQRERTAKRGRGRILSEQALAGREGKGFSFQQVAGTTPAPELDLVCSDLLSMLEDEPRAIALYRLMGYKNREIADLLGCTERKVERKLNLIRAIWEQEASGSDDVRE